MAKQKEAKQSWFKRHKVLTVILALVVIGILASALGGGDGSKGKSSNTAKADTATVAKVGEAARDGRFEFTVKSVECGKTVVGDNPYLTKTAQGQYCLLNVSVKNIGDKAQTLFSSNQKLLNAQGQEYSADDTATIYAAPSGASWLNDINPGNSVDGTIVFDLPKDQTPASAELHDSALSGGVKVNL
ncbi:MAG: hypothetical protein JWN82_318 [Candidatus Saccharibacteria bacterium]|nr:hypothetical protein [Candidatus Saccharibacteria bacterium]